MKIKKIKKLSNNKYKIELDDIKIVTYDEVILKYNLLYKKEISMDLLNEIEKESIYYDIYNKTLRYIITKMRSIKEITNYLEKKGIDKVEQQRIIEQLKKIGMLNDKSYATSYISDKINLSNMGPYKIKQELIIHNIAEDIIDDILSNYDQQVFNDKIIKIINKKVSANTKYSSYMLKQKIINELINLGYDKNDVLYYLNNVKLDNNIVEKEFNKLYKKLSIKYSDNELKLKIKNKLYQKGFSLEEINNVINENMQ